jgi:hypothetical protein
MIVDNFALSIFQSCPAKFDLRILQQWTTKRKSAALGFGGAFHLGLAEWYKTGSRAAMLGAVQSGWPDGMPVDDFRSKAKCVEALIAYTKEYPAENFVVVDGPDGKLIEVSFTLPTGLFLPMCPVCKIDCRVDGHWSPVDPLCPNCGAALEDLQYGGIFDGLVEFSGALYVLEHKTTSRLGDRFFDQFRPNNQVSGYVWGASQLSGKQIGGALINAIGVYKSSPTKFKRQVTMRASEEIDEWLGSVYNTCVSIQQAKITGSFPMHTGSCTMYGRCEYHAVHSLPFAKQRVAILEQDYQRSEWNHEARDEDSTEDEG